METEDPDIDNLDELLDRLPPRLARKVARKLNANSAGEEIDDEGEQDDGPVARGTVRVTGWAPPPLWNVLPEYEPPDWEPPPQPKHTVEKVDPNS